MAGHRRRRWWQRRADWRREYERLVAEYVDAGFRLTAAVEDELRGQARKQARWWRR
jgi:hypothetical protein